MQRFVESRVDALSIKNSDESVGAPTASVATSNIFPKKTPGTIPFASGINDVPS